MFSSQKSSLVPRFLVVEPDETLTTPPNISPPYSFLQSHSYSLTILPSIELARASLSKFTPDLVLLSMSFSPQKTIEFLEVLKNASTQKLIPLLFVVNLSQPISVVPGTTWGNKLSITHTVCTEKEFQTTLKRFL